MKKLTGKFLPKVKLGYKIVGGILIFCAVVFGVWVQISQVGTDPLANVIQGEVVFVTLLAAIIALAVAEPKRRAVKVQIEPTIDPKSCETHTIVPPVAAAIASHMNPSPSDDPKSYRVDFKITNVSGFTWEKPTLTFRLPRDKRHPNEDGQTLTFQSNLFNYQADICTLAFADTVILSNSNLLYWNDQDHVPILIRMLLRELESFTVEVSVNCEDAEGVTETVSIGPKCWLK